MKRFIILQALVLSLAACITEPGRTLLPVEQAGIESESMSLSETVNFIEPLLAEHGFTSDGSIFLHSTGGIDFRREYDGPLGSTASITAADGCISLVTWVQEGNFEYIAPRTAFNDVLHHMRQKDSWTIMQGGFCGPPPNNSFKPNLRRKSA